MMEAEEVHAVLASEVYRPEQWSDFFLAVGGGAAALTGLVFVALSLNVAVVTQDPTHRYRAIGTLVGFVSPFAVCSLALMGSQGHRAVGLEWAAIAAVAAGVYVYGYVQARRLGGSQRALSLARTFTGGALYVAEIAGACLLVADQRAGVYVAATSMVALLAWMISGAWLLIVGAPTAGRP